MQPTEALSLLRHGLPAGEEASLRSLAARLGEWPLLLRLVNGALRDRIDRGRDTLQGALEHVTRVLDRRGLTAFDARSAESRSKAVARTMGVSLELLSERERTLLKELAVFPEDVNVPIDTVALLWAKTGGLDELETEVLLQRLFGLSLLFDFDLATRRIRLHDVIRAYLRGEIGDGLAALDRELVEAYRVRCLEGWATGPNDGYFFQYLPGHVAGGEQLDELRALLLDVAWIEAKLRATDVGALVQSHERFGRDQTVRRMGEALRLSAHVLARDPGCVLSQLFGRIGQGTDTELASALTRASNRRPRPPWLRPRTASLTRPGGPLIQTLAGHTGWVSAVAVTPDGTRVVSGSMDTTLKVWDLASGRLLATLAGHTDWIHAVAVTPDGTRVVSGADEQQDTQGVGPCQRPPAGHPRGPHRPCHRGGGDARRHPRGGRGRPHAQGVDLASGRLLATLEGHTDHVTAVAVTPDGTRVVSGSLDKTLKVWDLASGRLLATLEGHSQVAVTPTPGGGGDARRHPRGGRGRPHAQGVGPRQRPPADHPRGAHRPDRGGGGHARRHPRGLGLLGHDTQGMGPRQRPPAGHPRGSHRPDRRGGGHARRHPRGLGLLGHDTQGVGPRQRPPWPPSRATPTMSSRWW